MARVTSHTVQVARRSGIGRSLELTAEDRERLALKEEERRARLARIVARSQNS
ncbi:hypothetical protein ACFV16_22585 [Streptomyces massasporeus]|uniref:hypothetical protein n=1 Tax=Streptomyces massasporeus TaxID=67324 RepID=UPI00368BFCBB